MVNVPVPPGIPETRPIGGWSASTTLSAADARLLQDRGGGAALAAIGRGRPRPAPLHARLAGASARSPRACGAPARASARGSSRSATSRSCCTRGAGSCTRSRGVDTLATHHDGPRAARAGAHRGRERRGAAEDVRRGRSVAARVRRALPAARRARRLRGRARATSPSIRCCSPSSSSCTGWRASPRGSRRARPAAAEGVPLVRFSAAAGGAVCGGCPGGCRCRPARSRRSPRCSRSPLAELPALTPHVAATVARCASDLNAEHGGFRLRSLALTAGG